MGKNCTSLLPVLIHYEEVIRVLPANVFRDCAPVQLAVDMPAKSTTMLQALAASCDQMCKAYDSRVIICKPTATANELYRVIGATCPAEIPFVCCK